MTCQGPALDVRCRYIVIVSRQRYTGAVMAAGAACGANDLFDMFKLGEKFARQIQRGLRVMARETHGGPWERGFGHWGGGFVGPKGAWWPGPPPPKPSRGPKASRGDVRSAILALLKEGPRNGYQIMAEIEERS